MKTRKAQYRAIYALNNKYRFKDMCMLMHIPQSSYYKWLKSIAFDRDLPLYETIKAIQEKVKYTYGYRRIVITLLKNEGLIINHKAVLRVMNKYNILSVIRRKRIYRSSEILHRYDNLFKRDFKPTGINQKWCTDISYIQTKEGVLYLSAIKDCFDSSIIAHRYSTSMSQSLVSNTIKDAVKKEKAANGTQLHSDQGFQYTSKAYNILLKEYNITPSMSRAGTPLDNAPIESFFGTLKIECVYRQKIQTIEQAKIIIDDYIDFYNNDRVQLKSKLTPAEVRRNYLAG